MISFKKILDMNPKVKYYPEFDPTGERDGVEFSGIKAITYDGADYMGAHTKIFAHIGFPKNTDKQMPAVVLVHGGGGHPEDVWIKKWNDRGYAAIAMDTTGFFPTKPIPYMCEGFADGVERKLVEPFVEDGYVVGPKNSLMKDCGLPIEDQWMYQAVVAVILAHNILRNDKRIDKDKIGICGISWGGIITSIVLGYDKRFAFAIPIYGSGYLGESLSNICGMFKELDSKIWIAENNFDDVDIPILWLCWNDDTCFSINSNSMSYLHTKANNRNVCLSMINNMRHSHAFGYNREESYWFADEVLKKNTIPNIEATYTVDRVYYSCSAKIKSVKLFYITDKMKYVVREKYNENSLFMEHDWQISELDSNESYGILPQNAVGKYIEFTLENGVVLTSPYCE